MKRGDVVAYEGELGTVSEVWRDSESGAPYVTVDMADGTVLTVQAGPRTQVALPGMGDLTSEERMAWRAWGR